MTPRSEGTGVSPAGCSSGCCKAAAGTLGRARGCLCILPLDLNHQEEDGQVAQAVQAGVSRAGSLSSDALQTLGTPGHVPHHLSPCFVLGSEDQWYFSAMSFTCTHHDRAKSQEKQKLLRTWSRVGSVPISTRGSQSCLCWLRNQDSPPCRLRRMQNHQSHSQAQGWA